MRLRPRADVPAFGPHAGPAAQRHPHRVRRAARDVPLLRRLPRRVRRRSGWSAPGCCSPARHGSTGSRSHSGESRPSRWRSSPSARSPLHAGAPPGRRPTLAGRRSPFGHGRPAARWPSHTLTVRRSSSWSGWASAAQHRIRAAGACPAARDRGRGPGQRLPRRAALRTGRRRLAARRRGHRGSARLPARHLGEYGGPGYAAAFALVAVRLSRRTDQGRAVTSVVTSIVALRPPVAVRLPHPVGRVDRAADAVDAAPRRPRLHHPRRARRSACSPGRARLRRPAPLSGAATPDRPRRCSGGWSTGPDRSTRLARRIRVRRVTVGGGRRFRPWARSAYQMVDSRLTSRDCRLWTAVSRAETR